MSKLSGTAGTAADWIWTRSGVNLMHSYPVLNSFWKRDDRPKRRHRMSRYAYRVRKNGHVTTKVRNP